MALALRAVTLSASISTASRGARPAMAYRLVLEFTDYEVLRVWGTPVRVDIEPLNGNIGGI